MNATWDDKERPAYRPTREQLLERALDWRARGERRRLHVPRHPVTHAEFVRWHEAMEERMRRASTAPDARRGRQ